MNNQELATSSHKSATQSLLDLIVDSIQDIKGKNIVQLDLRQLDDRPTDFFIICEGESTVQVKSIAENVRKRAKVELDNLAGHFEGHSGATWILVDFFDVVVHVFYPETREHYELEELWNDAIITQFEEM